MTDDKRWIPKGTKPHKCAGLCGAVVYRAWRWSDKASRHEPEFYDCEGSGCVRPSSKIGGVGRVHMCKKAVA